MEIYRSKTSKSFRAKNLIFLFIIVGLIAAAGIYLFFTLVVFKEKSWNKPIACDELYSKNQTENILMNNKVLLGEIEKAGGHYVYVNLRNDCEDKGEIIIMYNSTDQAQRIRDLVGQTFQGLPYRLVNG
ncbi:MAG: hypothetical protein WCV50_01730 [Patescibacteria group bacterium]|jgi:hypothetical protein